MKEQIKQIRQVAEEAIAAAQSEQEIEALESGTEQKQHAACKILKLFNITCSKASKLGIKHETMMQYQQKARLFLQ